MESEVIKKYNNLCRYIRQCWRFVYSLEIISNPWPDIAPNRMKLMFSGKTCSDHHHQKRCMFAEFFPFREDGRVYNLCPLVRLDDREKIGDGICYEHDFQELKRTRKYNISEIRSMCQKGDYEDQWQKLRKEPRLRYLPQEMKRAILERDRWSCVYCGRNIQRLKANGEKFVFDHFIPLSKGGGNEIDNFVVCCHRCNSEKSDQFWVRGCKIGER